MDIKLALITGLILISITLSIKIAGLLHRLKLSNRENETLRKENLEANKRQEQEIITINKKHSKTISDLKNENSNLIKEVSKFKKNKDIQIPEPPKYNFGQYE